MVPRWLGTPVLEWRLASLRMVLWKRRAEAGPEPSGSGTGGDEEDGLGAPCESGAHPAGERGWATWISNATGTNPQSSCEELQWSVHEQQQRSAAPVAPQANLSHVSKKQALGVTTPAPAGKAAGESEDDITLGDLREQQCL